MKSMATEFAMTMVSSIFQGPRGVQWIRFSGVVERYGKVIMQAYIEEGCLASPEQIDSCYCSIFSLKGVRSIPINFVLYSK